MLISAMATKKEHLDKLYEISVNRSFFYPSNEIYGSIAGFYDYGPIGVRIRRNIINAWRSFFVTSDVYELETSIILPEIVLKASGHVDGFTDPIIYCKKCGSKFRADHLIGEKEDGFAWDGSLETIDKKIKEHHLKCPNCDGEFTEAKTFNLMFKTGIGADNIPAYNRPETAQGIFTSFLRMFRSFGMKLPLILAQIGKSFRNEISPRQGLVRMREFTQMELEYFYNPKKQVHKDYNSIKEKQIRIKYKNELKVVKIKDLKEYDINQIMSVYLSKEWDFFSYIGLNPERIWFRILNDDETPHYSSKNVDMEVQTSYGVIEIDGNALRTDYDLKRHQTFSKRSMAILDQETNERYIPYVFELSIGLDRVFYAILDHSLVQKTEKKNWDWFNLKPNIAPYNLAVFSLVKKDGLRELADNIYSQIISNKTISAYVSHRGSIGKRYARADEIGVPYCITIDYQTKEDNTVTIRMRNDGWQTRINANQIDEFISKLSNNQIMDENTYKKYFGV